MGVQLKTAASFALFLFCLSQIQAAEKDANKEAMRDVRFCQELNDRGLSDYANTFLARRTKENPEGKTLYSTLAVDIYLRQGKFDEAQKLIQAVPKDSPAYLQCQTALAYYYFGKKEYQKARDILEPIYKKCQKERADAEQSGKSYDLDEYSRAIMILLNTYNQLDMKQEVSRLMAWYQGDTDPRSQGYIDAFLKLSNAEALRKRTLQQVATIEGKIARMLKTAQGSELQKLVKACRDLDKRYAALYNQSGNVDARVRQEREEAYRKLADFINIKNDVYLKHMTSELEAPRRLEAFSKRAELRDVNKQRELARGDDWRAEVMDACISFEDLTWEGQDITTAQASVQTVRALYLLGLYDQAIEESEKYPELMEICDQTYVGEGKAEASPAAGLKYWTGLAALEAARDLEKNLGKKPAKKKQDACIRMYRLAFVNLGRLVKNYPKYGDAANAYNQFISTCDRLIELDARRKNAYQKERAKLKKPEGALALAGAVSGAVPMSAQENFDSKQYDLVIEELFPLFQEKRGDGTSMAAILNKLILSCVYAGGDANMLRAQALARYAASVYPTDEQVKNAVRDAGTLAWQESVETAKNNKDAGETLKNDAIYFYSLYLSIDKAHPSASVIALQLARNDYNEANAIGERLNKSKDPKERAALKEDWDAAQEKVIEAYRVIIDNFSNKEDYANEAYDKVCSALVLLKRYEDAAKAYEQFANATHDPALKAYAKENIAEMICQIARSLEMKAQGLREKISEIVIPEEPADAASDAQKTADDAQIAEAEKTVPDAVDQAKAQEAAMLKAEKAQLEKEADAAEKQVREQYAKACDHILEFRKLLPTLELKSDTQKQDVAATVQRADSLLPWLYDGAGKKQEAAKEFAAYIKKYADDKQMLPSFMMRLGVLYTEMNMEQESQSVLTELRSRFPESPEGKNASFYLARSLYQNGNYSRALPVFGEIFSTELVQELSVSNLRWIASNLVNCTNQDVAKAAAEFSLKASEQLLDLMQDPAYLKLGFACDKPENLAALIGTASNEVLKNWVGAARATELLNNVTEMQRYLSLTKQKLLFDAGVAAWKTGDAKKADRYLTEVEELDSNSPYMNDVYFLRAEIRISLKRYEDARRDLARVATRGMQLKRLGYWNKAQVLTGETYLAEKDYNKAYASFSFVADALLQKTKDQIDSHSASPEFAPYLEQALYRAAFCASLLGMNQEPDFIVDQYVKKYGELYPNGKYASEIRNLPKPITQK